MAPLYQLRSKREWLGLIIFGKEGLRGRYPGFLIEIDGGWDLEADLWSYYRKNILSLAQNFAFLTVLGGDGEL